VILPAWFEVREPGKQVFSFCTFCPHGTGRRSRRYGRSAAGRNCLFRASGATRAAECRKSVPASKELGVTYSWPV